MTPATTFRVGNRFGDALAYATALHHGQTRKGGDIPYISHLLAVSALALEHGADEDTAIAALLHDSLEDQPGRVKRADIEERFGLRVAELVVQTGEADKSLTWKQRNEAYIQHLARADDDAILISICDKVHNATSMAQDHAEAGDGFWQIFNAGRDEQAWKYRALLQAFKDRDANPRLVGRLERQLKRMEFL